MKIAILTQGLHFNYGGILQNYALQKVLKDLGHIPITVDRDVNRKYFFCRDIIILILQKIHFDRIPFVITSKQYLYICKNVFSFIRKYISVTHKIHNEKDFYSTIKKMDFEAFVVGSDQVWRPKYSPNIYNYYLDFVTDTKKERCIAYGVSFGVDEWEYSKEQAERCRKLVKRFDAISVREKSGIELCNQYLGVDAKFVLDPTLLLDREYYIDLITSEKEDYCGEDIFYYVLDMNAEKEKFISEISSLLNLQAYTIMPQKLNYKTLKSISSCIYPSVTKWLKCFMDAKFIVTDSYHGCVFSIIFNKPFIALGNKGRGLDRFKSLLELFNLENRLVLDGSARQYKSVIFESIDWNSVNMIKKNMSDESMSFLKKSLHNERD